MILRTLVSRGFLRPSHHYVPSRKQELLIRAPWGVVQVWREYSGRLDRKGHEPRVYFLRFLGSRGRAEMATLDPADRLENTAAEVWTVNPPAFGGTTGPADLERYADCALLAMDHLRTHAEGKPIWVCGKSIGTAAALLAAASGGAKGLVLRNAMPLRELLSRHYALRTAGLSRFAIAPAIPSRLDSIQNASRLVAPALFLVSRQDRVVPPPYQQRVISAYGGRTTVLEVAGGHDERALRADDEAAYRRTVKALIEDV
jgi:pimeloyl-ACP methyl ester carboxylesterase